MALCLNMLGRQIVHNHRTAIYQRLHFSGIQDDIFGDLAPQMPQL